MSLHVSDVMVPERAKYREIWDTSEYQESWSPGLENVAHFMAVLRPKAGETLVDIGCGAGRAGLDFRKHGLQVMWTDLVNVLDPEVPKSRFIECPIWDCAWHRPHGFDYGFCCDVMEHVPTEYTMLTIDRIARSCRTTWFVIHFEPDVMGQLIGKPLHLTVQPFTWWRDRIASLGNLVDARDLCGRGLFITKR